MFRNTFCQILPPWSMNVQKFLPSMRNLKLLGWFCLRILLKCLATRTMRGKERIFCTDVDLARKSRFFHSPPRLSKQCSLLEGREAIFFRFNHIADLWYTLLWAQTFIGIYRAKQNTNLPTHKRRWTDVNKIFLHLVWVFCLYATLKRTQGQIIMAQQILSLPIHVGRFWFSAIFAVG